MHGPCSGPRGAWRYVLTALTLVTAGCASDAVVAPPPKTDVSQLYWALTLDHHAVTLSTVAPYDTIRLTATPRTVNGDVLADLPAPTYTSLDLDRAHVDPDGLVHVVKTGTKIPVVATLVVGNVRHADTAFINVTSMASPTLPVSLSIDPKDRNPLDSAKIAEGTAKTLSALIKNASGTTINGLAVYYVSLDPTVAKIDRSTGRLEPVHPGHVTLIASATAYGVTVADTLVFKIGYALFVNPNFDPAVNNFVPSRIIIGAGGNVVFFNGTGTAVDVTFDDPSAALQDTRFCPIAPIVCGTGNIDAFSAQQDRDNGVITLPGARGRSFAVPGTYPFHSTIFGTTGEIVVMDESTL
ncbi:MAG: hypothetical protein IRY91_04140 [Gemmatimonadaceae bacterium]|nr:hypothetical protein [Gemmatimonadaceae bacterium]